MPHLIGHDRTILDLLRQHPQLYRHHWIIVVLNDVALLDRAVQRTPRIRVIARPNPSGPLLWISPWRQQGCALLCRVQEPAEAFDGIAAAVQAVHAGVASEDILEARFSV
jgi:hypothetical protein